MKRIIAVFLLFLMLLVGIRPVLAMHFCHGNLSSVSFINDGLTDKSCCASTDHRQHKTSERNGEANDNASTPLISDIHKNCCDFQKIELSTDDYNHHADQLSLNTLYPTFDNVSLILNYLANCINPDETIIAQHIFPPEGLNKLTLDLLTFICIYRI